MANSLPHKMESQVFNIKNVIKMTEKEKGSEQKMVALKLTILIYTNLKVKSRFIIHSNIFWLDNGVWRNLFFQFESRG